MAKTYCENCNITHSAIMCFYKKRKPLKINLPNYTWRETVVRWHMKNPPDQYGYWHCYLQISPYCLKRLDKLNLVLEHVIPKSRGKKYKYDISNIRPSCAYCNALKGSRMLEDLAKDYPQLEVLL